MLNIGNTSVRNAINSSDFKSYKKLSTRSSAHWFWKVLVVLSLIIIISMFLPWTQNIRSKGYVSTLNPYDKPQHIQAIIEGKIDRWYAREGDQVLIGDTIVVLTEVKSEYFDPDLLDNTTIQQEAKERSALAYARKSEFLRSQLKAYRFTLDAKLKEFDIKKQQLDIETQSQELELEAANTYAENANKQLARMEIMFDKGIKSLTDLETKRLSMREAEAKKLSIENKLRKLTNDQRTLLQDIEQARAEYDQKVAKTESEIQSTDSYRYSLIGETNKLQSKFNEISERQNAFVITSPINGRLTKVLKNGIGEIVKAQDKIATIVPNEYQKAVELYIEPFDMPLIKEGKKVRMQFDGWPAIVFSGWPDNSFGTFNGEVYAVDNDISENGKYRILVIEEEDSDKAWPELIRIGSGVQGLLLLNDVKIYYELWRQLNGFPPDFYNPEEREDIKNKAPIRKFK